MKINKETLACAALWLLLLAGLAFRVWGAWAFRHITDPDCGVVALMARHMAEGRAWPVFFYGQSYMGSLEPALSALCCRIFGISGFAVCLGTALAAAGALVFTYLWGRDAGGRTAGMAALALCIIGPPGFFLFQFAPRGGYMVAMMLGIYAMWHASLLSRRLILREKIPSWHFLLLGLGAGLGWWSNQLITSALVAAAVVLAIGWRGRIFNRGVLLGIAGFAAGSSPFWIWNALHSWDSFNMLSNLGAISPVRGLRHLMSKSWRFIGANGEPHALAVAAAVLTGAAVLLGIFAALWRFRKTRQWRGSVFCAVVFIVVSCWLFVRSSYAVMNTTRYLVPLFPALAVLSGVAVSALPRRGFYAAPAALTILLMLPQLPVVRQVALEMRESAAGAKQIQGLADFLETSNIEAVYSHFRYYPYNFHLGERWPFTDMRGDRVPEITQRAELARRAAVFDNHGQIETFLRVCGGDASQGSAAGRRMTWDFRPPPLNLEEIPAAVVTSITDSRGHDMLGEVTDRNVDTYWDHPLGDSRDEDVEIIFAQPVTASRVRLLAPAARFYPRNLKIKALYEGDENWTPVHPVHAVPEFYWSGARPFWGGRRFRLEYKLPPKPMLKLRLTEPREDVESRELWAISEIQLFAPAEEASGWREPFAELAGLLEQRGTKILYSDRGPANALIRLEGFNVRTELEPSFFPENALCVNGEISWTPHTAFLVLRQDVPVTARTLEEFDIRMRQTEIGPWALFDFEDPEAVPSVHVPLHWTGFNVIKGQGREHARIWLDRAFGIMRGQGDPEEALAALIEAVEYYPNFITVSGKLLGWLKTRADGATLSALETAFSEAANPSVPAVREFSNGIKLLGVTPPVHPVKPGETVNVRWFWQCPADVDPSKWAVFVHFKNGSNRFQDDHIFLENVRRQFLKSQDQLEIFSTDRRFTVPLDAVPGLWNLETGLYDIATGKRLRPAGKLIDNISPIKLKGVLEVLNPDR
ncbi:MAG: hypothetical protein AB7T27_01245 [Kiritimatiellia bacterium]